MEGIEGFSSIILGKYFGEKIRIAKKVFHEIGITIESFEKYAMVGSKLSKRWKKKITVDCLIILC